MSKQDREPLPSISLADLGAVTGGNHKVGHPTGSGGNTQVTAALQAITDSLKGLSSQNTSSSNSLTQMLPMLMLMKGGAGGGCPGGNCGR